MKPTSIICCIIILTSACSTSKQIITVEEICGKYYWRTTFVYDVFADIQLNPDNTFEYNWTEGMLNGTTVGTWELNKNILVLNSEKQPEEQEKREKTFNLISHPSTNEDSLRIEAIDIESKESVPFVSCNLNYNSKVLERIMANEFGVCKLSKFKQADKLSIKHVGYEDAEIPLSQLTGNSYTVELALGSDCCYYKYFTNRKWKIKGNRIYDSKIKRDKYNEKYYLKAD